MNKGTKLFQIKEADLATLEADVPALCERLILIMQNHDRVRMRRVQAILSNVRWNYGPPSEIERIDCEGARDE